MSNQLEKDKTEFIEFLIKQNVLKFGEFTLKSGRQSPYFFNLGSVASGAAFAALGRAYARTIVQSGIEFDLLSNELGASVISIAHVTDVLAYLADDAAAGESFAAMSAYITQHCVR